VTRLSLISDDENGEPCDPQIPLEVHYSVSAGGARAQRWMGLLFGLGYCMWVKQMGVAYLGVQWHIKPRSCQFFCVISNRSHIYSTFI